MVQQQSTVHLGLGSNVGDRLLMLRRAVTSLEGRDGVRVIRVSSVYETAPWGLIEQPDFYNIAVEIETTLAPLELLKAVKMVEKRLGRLPGVHWGPRTIDIDLILWGALTMDTPLLTLPHKRFRERAFVLTPLAELDPDVVDPETGETVTALLRKLAPQPLTRCAEMIYS